MMQLRLRQAGCASRSTSALPLASKASSTSSVAVMAQPTRHADAPCTTTGESPALLPRRVALLGLGMLLTGSQAGSVFAAQSISELEEAAFEAYANRDFKATVQLLTNIMEQQPKETRWLEMRGQVLVDGKNFDAAITDFDAALKLCSDDEPVLKARLLAGRALALEGISDWEGALRDYDGAMASAQKAGESPDPYIINSMGNCYNSLGRWAEARENYLTSSQLFQQAKGFRGRNGGTTDRVDGAIYSASNAALMLAQMGDLDGALKEMERIARRAPGSADMRAGLAALYWDKGLRDRAEDEWEWACTKINVGCTKYRDPDWLGRIRRWPPVMVEKMQQFVKIVPAA